MWRVERLQVRAPAVALDRANEAGANLYPFVRRPSLGARAFDWASVRECHPRRVAAVGLAFPAWNTR
jgi:hypothetical protein